MNGKSMSNESYIADIFGITKTTIKKKTITIADVIIAG